MLSVRIVTVGAIVWSMAIGNASAQAATNTTPRQPVLVLQIVTQPEKAKTRLYRRRISKLAGKRQLVVVKEKAVRPLHPAQTAASDRDTVARAEVTSITPTVETPPAITEPEPSQLVAGGSTVQFASPEDADDIDLAATAPNSTPAVVPAAFVAAADQATPAAATSAQREPSPAGNASWIAQVVAALGGAIAAGCVAWFLIGSTPQRTYG